MQAIAALWSKKIAKYGGKWDFLGQTAILLTSYKNNMNIQTNGLTAKRRRPHFRRLRAVAIPGEPNSETRIALLRIEGARALYRLEPVTGKRHQLRVHMMGMGIPIEGDQFYPQVLRGPHAPEDFGQPLQLLAHSVAFTDPLTGLAHQFTSRQELLL